MRARAAVIGAIAGSFVLSATAAATAGQAVAGPACLWAGTAHESGTTIVAGGQFFRCDTVAGSAHWTAVAQASPTAVAVENPGAVAHPDGRFSPGARQPGSSYTDYCVGPQLIEGGEDVYQVVRTRGGVTLWKAVGPITEWTFAERDPRPEPTHRTAASCIDGVLT